MKNTKLKQKKMLMFVVILISMMMLPLQSKAVLQANLNTHMKKKDTHTNWMTNIRNMEKSNQAMGLEETIDETTKKTTSKSNNIDVHMFKSTEYGAVAILSTSGYGNPQWIQNSTIKSTTGNKSGVYFLTGWAEEAVAGGLKTYIFNGVDSKYYDEYTSSVDSSKVGDALKECSGWHNGDNKFWLRTDIPYFVRDRISIFGYFIDNNAYSRAAVVCGEGF